MTPPSSSLAGKRVLIARAAGQSEEAARLVTARGAVPVVIPSIVMGPPDDEDALRRALLRGTAFDWVVFTSANGVEHTWRALERHGLPRFGPARFAVVGAATREALEARGAVVGLQAKEFRGSVLAEALLGTLDASATASATRVLILRAQEASDDLPDALKTAGVHVEVVAVYRTRPSAEGGAAIRRCLEEKGLDAVVFASGSTVESICDALGPSALELLATVTVACIGPVTLATALARGVRVDVVPPVATFPDVLGALEEHFRAI